MRPIHLAALDKTRPVVILTREGIRPHLAKITIAPITSRIRGATTEIPVGPPNGLDHDSVVTCDNLTTIPSEDIGKLIGFLLPDQERLLTEALVAAFDLEVGE